MAPTKGFFSRRKYSTDELRSYADPIEAQSLIAKDPAMLASSSRHRPGTGARVASGSGGTVPMLAAAPSRETVSLQRATAVVAGGGAAGLVFAPAMARRNASLPAITFVKGPISAGTAGVSSNALDNALSAIPPTQATYYNTEPNNNHSSHHSRSHMSTLSNDSTATTTTTNTTSSRSRKTAVNRSKSDANKLTAFARALRGKRKDHSSKDPEDQLRTPVAPSKEAPIIGTGGDPGQSPGQYFARPSTTSSDAYSIASSPPPTPPMKSPWTLSFSSTPLRSQTPLLQPPSTASSALHQLSSTPNTPPHSPFPPRPDAATSSMPARTLAMNRLAPSTPPISPEEEMRKMAGSSAGGRMRTESEMMVEISNLRRALASRDDMIRRLDTRGVMMSNASGNASTTTLGRASISSGASGMSETQRVNQVLSRRIRELEASLAAQNSRPSEEWVNEKINDVHLSHAKQMESLRKAHAEELQELRQAIDRMETRSPTPPPQLPPLNGLGIDMVDEGYSTPKRARELRLEDLMELRDKVDGIERLVTTQIMDFVEEAESAAQNRTPRQKQGPIWDTTSVETLREELERERKMRKEAERKLSDTILKTQGELESAMMDQNAIKTKEQERKLEEQEKRIYEYADAYEQERKKRFAAEHNLARAEQALANSSHDLENIRQNGVPDTSILARLQVTYDNLVQEHQHCQSDLYEMRAIHETLMSDVDVYKVQVESLSHEINRLKGREKELIEVSNKISEAYQTKCKQLDQVVGELKKERERKEKVQNQLAASADALNRTTTQMNELLHREVQPNPELSGRISALSDENLQLRARNRSIEEDLSRSHDEANLFKRRLEQFMGQQSVVLGDLQQQILTLRKEKQTAERRLLRLQKGWEERKDPLLEEQKAAARKLERKAAQEKAALAMAMPPITSIPPPAEEEDMVIVW